MTALAKDLGVAAPEIDVLRQSPLWSGEPEAEAIVVRAIRTAAEAILNANGEVAVVLTDDAAIRVLNRDWRKLDKPTNVLSFPAPPRSAVPGTAIPSMAGDAPALLGDIVIAYETTAREALAEDKPFPHHLAHLAVHGFLHLLGYDHESDAAAQDMERLEARILAQLGVPDPYLMRETGS